MTRPTYTKFRKEALRDPKVKELYESLSAAYDLKKNIITRRKKAQLPQKDVSHKNP